MFFLGSRGAHRENLLSFPLAPVVAPMLLVSLAGLIDHLTHIIVAVTLNLLLMLPREALDVF